MALEVNKGVANVDVSHELYFDENDVGQRYTELYRIIGDDTGVGEPAAALGDDMLASVDPLSYRETRVDEAGDVTRHVDPDLRPVDLHEDHGPNPDELRARVTLTRVPDAQTDVVRRETNLVNKDIDL